MMTQIHPDQQGHLGGLAYRLGFAAIALDLDVRRRWESAEPGNPPDEFFGPEERSSPFPMELGRFSEVINDASRRLVAALPELTRDQLNDALLRAWLALKKAWLGPSHRRMIVEREEGAGGGVDTITASPLGWREWSDFHLAVHQFCESLPEGLRDCAALGAHVAAVGGIQPPGDRQEALPETVSSSPFAVLKELLPKVIKFYPALQGLELDLSEAHYLATNVKPPHSYWCWRQNQVERLNDQILERLPEFASHTNQRNNLRPDEGTCAPESAGQRPEGADFISSPYQMRDTTEEWISAKDAELLARKYEVELPLHRIRRLIAKDPAPFRVRKPSPQRLELPLAEVLLYINKERERRQSEIPGSGQSEPKQPTELQVSVEPD